MSEIKIVGTVVLYNPDNEVVNNIATYAGKFDKLYLVDNSETSNEKMFQRVLKEKVYYIPLKHNFGIAYALNIAFNNAINEGYKYIVSLDQDSVFDNDILKVYRECINNHNMVDVAALTPQYNTARMSAKKSKSIEEVKLTMQSGSLFVLDKFKKIGKFNEDLFLDVVDWEYFYRIRKMGMKTLRCNEAVLNHQPAITNEIKIGLMKLKYGTASPVRYYYQVRNLYWMAKEYKSAYMFNVMIFKFFKVIFLFEQKGKYLKYCMQGLKDVKANQFGAYSDATGDKNGN